jgi:hypothetical protein
MCATLKDISHRQVRNAANREANGIKMLQRTRDNSQRQFVAFTYRVGSFPIETFEYDNRPGLFLGMDNVREAVASNCITDNFGSGVDSPDPVVSAVRNKEISARIDCEA